MIWMRRWSRIRGASRARRPSSTSRRRRTPGRRGPRDALRGRPLRLRDALRVPVARLVLAPGEDACRLALAKCASDMTARASIGGLFAKGSLYVGLVCAAVGAPFGAAAARSSRNAPENDIAACARRRRLLLPPGALPEFEWRLRSLRPRARRREGARCCPACTSPARCCSLCAPGRRWRRRGRRASSRRAARSWPSERSSPCIWRGRARSGARRRVREGGRARRSWLYSSSWVRAPPRGGRRQSRPWRRTSRRRLCWASRASRRFLFGTARS